MGFVFFVLKGFEKEKIERFDRLWVSKRKKEKEKKKKETLFVFHFSL